LYAEGISREGDLLDIGAARGIVQKAGAWYQYESEKIGQGRESARQFLKSNPKIANEIEEKIRTVQEQPEEATVDNVEANEEE
jgi:recombination protein RecA